MKAQNKHQNSPHKRQSKDKYNKTQLQKVFKAFYSHPQTMLMADNETGVRRENICRYVAKLKKADLICEIKKSKCEISNYTAGYYTTNPDLFIKSNQLKLF